MPSLSSEKYVRLTTFTKAGERKEVPVWIADLGDGTVGFTTGANSWKVKRMRNTPNVELTPSDMRGRVKDGAATTEGTAVIVEAGDVSRVRAAVKAKYGFQMTMIGLVDKVKGVFGKSDEEVGVIITTG